MASPEKHRERREARIEDVQFMLDTGEHISRIARRLGIKESTVEKFIERNGLGRHDPHTAA